MHIGLTIITALFHAVLATHGFTGMIDILICVIAPFAT